MDGAGAVLCVGGGSEITNADEVAVAPDDFAVAWRVEARLQDKFGRTQRDIRRFQESARVGGVEDPATHHAVALAKDDKRGHRHAETCDATALPRSIYRRRRSNGLRSFHPQRSGR